MKGSSTLEFPKMRLLRRIRRFFYPSSSTQRQLDSLSACVIYEWHLRSVTYKCDSLFLTHLVMLLASLNHLVPRVRSDHYIYLLSRRAMMDTKLELYAVVVDWGDNFMYQMKWKLRIRWYLFLSRPCLLFLELYSLSLRVSNFVIFSPDRGESFPVFYHDAFRRFLWWA